MPRYIAEVARQSGTGLPGDQAENVWHFSSAGSGPGTTAEAAAIVTALATFYTVGPTGSLSPVQVYLSSAWSETTIVKVYDEDVVTKPKPILHSGNFEIITSASPLPENVALCLSYRSTANAPRHRGRIYMGPLGNGAMDDSGSTQDAPLVESRPSVGFRQSLAAAAGKLVGEQTGGVTWCLRSGLGAGTWNNKTKTGTKIVTYEPVQGGWVDNEWDTVRSRRIKASTRSLFP